METFFFWLAFNLRDLQKKLVEIFPSFFVDFTVDLAWTIVICQHSLHSSCNSNYFMTMIIILNLIVLSFEIAILFANHRARYDLRKYFFTNRVANNWNSLPSHVVHADTVNSFKSRLDNFWKVEMYYMIIMLKFMEPEAEVKLVQNFVIKYI